MSNTLITFGDSFTYGEALIYEIIKKYHPFQPEKNMQPPQNFTGWDVFILSEMIKDFDDYRKENNYSYFLKELLNVSLISNYKNGGRNVDRLIDLDFIIEKLQYFKDIQPKYLVFQLTHFCRDIEDMLVFNVVNEEYVKKTYGNKLIDKVKNSSKYEKEVWNVDELLNESTEIFINELTKRFKILEKNYGTKCVFFFGLGSIKTIKDNYESYKLNPYFMEIINNNVLYYTWLDMNELLNLTIQKTTGYNDDHPASISHKWIAHELFKKLTS